MSALSTSETRLPYRPTASQARLTTSMHSSQSPSIVVNIESVRLGNPESRTTRTASATAAETEAPGSPPDSSPTPDGATEKAINMGPPYRWNGRPWPREPRRAHARPHRRPRSTPAGTAITPKTVDCRRLASAARRARRQRAFLGPGVGPRTSRASTDAFASTARMVPRSILASPGRRLVVGPMQGLNQLVPGHPRPARDVQPLRQPIQLGPRRRRVHAAGGRALVATRRGSAGVRRSGLGLGLPMITHLLMGVLQRREGRSMCPLALAILIDGRALHRRPGRLRVLVGPFHRAGQLRPGG